MHIKGSIGNPAMLQAMMDLLKDEDEQNIKVKIEASNQAKEELNDVKKSIKDINKQKIDLSKLIEADENKIKRQCDKAVRVINKTLDKVKNSPKTESVLSGKDMLDLLNNYGTLKGYKEAGHEIKYPRPAEMKRVLDTDFVKLLKDDEITDTLRKVKYVKQKNVPLRDPETGNVLLNQKTGKPIIDPAPPDKEVLSKSEKVNQIIAEAAVNAKEYYTELGNSQERLKKISSTYDELIEKEKELTSFQEQQQQINAAVIAQAQALKKVKKEQRKIDRQTDQMLNNGSDTEQEEQSTKSKSKRKTQSKSKAKSDKANATSSTSEQTIPSPTTEDINNLERCLELYKQLASVQDNVNEEQREATKNHISGLLNFSSDEEQLALEDYLYKIATGQITIQEAASKLKDFKATFNSIPSSTRDAGEAMEHFEEETQSASNTLDAESKAWIENYNAADKQLEELIEDYKKYHDLTAFVPEDENLNDTVHSQIMDRMNSLGFTPDRESLLAVLNLLAQYQEGLIDIAQAKEKLNNVASASGAQREAQMWIDSYTAQDKSIRLLLGDLIKLYNYKKQFPQIKGAGIARGSIAEACGVTNSEQNEKFLSIVDECINGVKTLEATEKELIELRQMSASGIDEATLKILKNYKAQKDSIKELLSDWKAFTELKDKSLANGKEVHPLNNANLDNIENRLFSLTGATSSEEVAAISFALENYHSGLLSIEAVESEILSLTKQIGEETSASASGNTAQGNAAQQTLESTERAEQAAEELSNTQNEAAHQNIENSQRQEQVVENINKLEKAQIDTILEQTKAINLKKKSLEELLELNKKLTQIWHLADEDDAGTAYKRQCTSMATALARKFDLKNQSEETQSSLNRIVQDHSNGKIASTEEAIEQIKALVHVKERVRKVNEEVVQSASETTNEAAGEAESAEKVQKSFTEAAKAKDKFKTKNEEVAAACDNSVDGIQKEGEALNEISERKAFLDPEIDKEEWDWVVEKAKEIEYELNEIKTIQRQLNGDKVSYVIKGTNGNSKTVARNSDNELLNSRQMIVDNTAEIKAQDKANQEFVKRINTIHNKLKGFKEDGKYIEGVKEEYEQLCKAGRNIGWFSEDRLKDYERNVNKFFDGIRSGQKVAAEDAAVTALASKMSSFYDANTRMPRQAREEIEKMIKTLHSGATVSKTDLKDMAAKFNQISSEVKVAHKTGNSFFMTVGKQLRSTNAQLVTTYLSWMDFIRYGRQAFETVRKLDDALVDLKKTTSMSSKDLEAFYNSSSGLAKELGVTTGQIIEQASAWSRLGYSSKEEAETMAQLSSKFASISPGMSVDNATDGLVSTMQAFGVAVDDVERDIMDNINRIGNTMATSNDEIVEMLKRSSAAMYEANNSIKETIALESAAVQITRNAETTGTAFRTISMRIRGYSEETEEYIGGVEELSGKIAELTKSAKPGGVSLFTDETKSTYKSTYQILKEIAAIYHDLTDKNQAALLETLAGKRGGQVLAGILNDFSQVEKAMNEMGEAAGSADAEMEIIKESISFKLNDLKETWTGIITDVVKRGSLAHFIDSLTSISEAIANIIKNGKPLIPMIAAFGVSLGGVHDAGIGLGSFKNMTFQLNEYNEMLGKTTAEQARYRKALKNSATPMSKYLQSLGEGKASIKGYTTSLVSATAKTIGLQVATIALQMAISAGITIAIGLLINGISKLVHHQENLRKSAVEAAQSFKEEAKSIDDTKQKYKELSDKLADSNTSFEEAMSIKEELASVQDNLNEKYADEVGYLDLVNGKYEEQIELIDEAARKKAEDYVDNSNDNKSNYNTAKRELTNRDRKFSVTDTGLYGDTEIDQKLIAWLQSYGNGLQVSDTGLMYAINFDVDYEHAKETLSQFATDYRKALVSLGKDVDNDSLLYHIRDEIDKIDTAAIEGWQEVRDTYEDNLLIARGYKDEYKKAEDAVQAYNAAVASGTGVKEAEENLKSIQEAINNIDFGQDSGIKDKFDSVFAGIDKDAEKAYDIVQKINAAYADDYLGNIDNTRIKQEIAELEKYYDEEEKLFKKYKGDKNQTLFGNVDLSVEDRYIEWTTENIEKYGKALESWGQKAEDYLGAISTEDSRVETIKGIDVAYTPMLYDEETHTTKYLDKKTVTEYLNKVFEDCAGDYSLDNVLKNDPKHLIMDVGETALQTSMNAHFAGPNGALEGTKSKIADLNDELKETDNVIVKDIERINELGLTNAQLTDITQLSSGQQFYFRQLAADLDISYAQLKKIIPTLVQTGKIGTQVSQDAATNAKYTAATITDAVNSINTKIKTPFEAMGKVYDSIFNGDNGFTLKDVSTDLLKGIVDSYVEGAKELGISAEEASESANKFMSVITNQKSTASQVHQAFNDLATSYFYSADGLSKLNAETAAAITQMLKQMGVVNADAIVNAYLEQAEAARIATENGYELSAVTASEIVGLQDLGTITKATADMLSTYAYQKQASNVNELTTTESVNELYNLALQCGITGEAFEALELLLAQFATADKWAAKGATDTAAWIRETAVKQYKKSLEIATKDLEIKVPDTTKSSGKSGKDAADAYVEAYEKELKHLDNLKAQGLITEHDYLEQLKALIDKYFKDRAKYAEKYAEELAKYMDQMKSHYDSVISGVTTLLSRKISALQKSKDKAIKAINEEKEAALKALEEEKKAMEESYKAQIKSIDDRIKGYEKQQKALQKQIDKYQEEIDAINEANDARKDAMELQKAEYELQRALNQRTKLVFTGEAGQMRYEADQTNVRDAQENVQDKKKEQEVKAIEKKIEALEKESKKYDEIIEKLEEEKEKLQEAMDKETEYYDQLISDTTEMYDKMLKDTEKYWDALIEKLEQTKSKWEQLAEVEQISQAWGLVSEEMARLGFTVQDVLNDMPGAFEAFKSTYINVLSQMHSKDTDWGNGLKAVTSGAVSGFEEMNGAVTTSKDTLGTLSESIDTLGKDGVGQIQGVEDEFNTLKDNVSNVTTEGLGFADSEADDGTLIGGIKSTSAATTEEVAGTATENFQTLQEKVREATAEVGTLKDQIKELKDGSPYEITIKINTEGEIPTIPTGGTTTIPKPNYTGTATTGQAHYEGTANVQGNWGVQQGGKSLVGELGQEMLIRGSNFKTIGDNGPEFIDLQKGDIILNHLQTAQLLSKKNLVSPSNMHGKAFASGSAYSSISKSSPISGLQSKVQSVIGQIIPTITTLTKTVEKNTVALQRHFDKSVLKSSNNQPNITITNPQFTVQGVTGEEVVKKIEGEFAGLMLSAYQKATK